MKRLFLWTILFLLFAHAGANAETCIRSAPNGATLEVHTEASTRSPVLGKINVGTCGVRVTNQCEGRMCVIVLGGLNGWVDMVHVANSPVVPPALMASQDVTGTLVYAVTGGSGTVTAAGITRPTPVDGTGEITVRILSSTSATLVLPPEATDEQITLSGQGAGPWIGGFGSWGGMPMPVSVTFNGLGQSSANLVLEGANQIAAMKISLNLSARSLPQAAQSATPTAPAATTTGSSQTSSAVASESACRQLDLLTTVINSKASTKQIQDMRGIYVLAGLVTTGSSPGEPECQKALDLIAMQPDLWQLAESEAVAAANTNTQPQSITTPGQQVAPQAPAVTPSAASSGAGGQLAQACAVLQPLVSPLLRGQSQQSREQTLRIMAGHSIVSVSSASPSQCAAILAGLINAGLVANDGVAWAELAASQTPSGGGEDPATMIAGGREIGIDPSDFTPEFNPPPQPDQVDSASQTASVSSQGGATVTAADHPCIQLGDAMVIAIRIGFSNELSRFSDILKKHRVETLAPSASAACASALEDARQVGLTR